MNDDKKRSVIIQYWWSKAEESLASAQREFKAKSFSYAMNRIYYVAFYGVSAALFDHRKSFKKHSGVRAAFHKLFIKTGLLDLKYGKFYDQLFEDRKEGDYITFVSFEPDYVRNQLDLCSEFLKKLRPLISLLSEDNNPQA